MNGYAVYPKQIGENFQDILGGQLALDELSQALTRVFIDDVQNPKRNAVVGPILHEFIAPNMFGILMP